MTPPAHPTTGPPPDAAAVGGRVRRIRQRLGLTVEEFARASQLSTGIVSQLERGQGNPSLTTLGRLADGLGVQVADLVREDSSGRSALVRAEGRLQLPLAEDPEGLVRELLTPTLEAPMQVIRTVMPAHTSHEQRPFRHLGTESVHVLAGRLVVVIGDERHELEAGDTITYDCTLGHWWENTSDEPAELIGMTVPLAL
ncbi:helix-turn-helix domain-containing protein [Ornithinimicrobium cryptoxanthini]|uniref:Cupin domain-containing protein n=1 Tax=Ornithinimicrobium cryptoxanthini TaxID=2934161 RepID=A0ABY4YKQ4_9MICO|nr:cupin domain-containing protein [Ornithinimicrobium cryptoxanthini]USQ77380.1 cupin domain-containing protein [Ornithinimicrobium cryptoxanthini]